MINPLKAIFYNRWYLLFLVVFSLVAGYFALEQLNNRRYVDATTAKIMEEVVEIGSEGYGYVTGVYFEVGEKVSVGDILYTYASQDLEAKLDKLNNVDNPSTQAITELTQAQEFIVKSPVQGIVSEVGVILNSYVTKDDIAFKLQTADSLITAELKVSPQQIDMIQPESMANIYLPDGRHIKGHIKTIFPQYDSETQTLKALVELDDPNVSLLNGIEVHVRVRINDQLADSVFSALEASPVPILAQTFQ